MHWLSDAVCTDVNVHMHNVKSNINAKVIFGIIYNVCILYIVI